MFSPVPEFIAAVIPTTRLVALALGHQRLPNTCVYCGGAGACAAGLRRRGHALGDRLGLRRVPLLHALQAAVLGGREALALDGRAVHDDGPLRLEGRAQRARAARGRRGRR